MNIKAELKKIQYRQVPIKCPVFLELEKTQKSGPALQKKKFGWEIFFTRIGNIRHLTF